MAGVTRYTYSNNSGGYLNTIVDPGQDGQTCNGGGGGLGATASPNGIWSRGGQGGGNMLNTFGTGYPGKGADGYANYTTGYGGGGGGGASFNGEGGSGSTGGNGGPGSGYGSGGGGGGWQSGGWYGGGGNGAPGYAILFWQQ